MKPEELDKLAAALSKAQAEITDAVKDAENPFFKSSYATLSSVWAACRGPLTKNGLSVTQTTELGPEGETVLVTTLLHSSGQHIQGRYPLHPVKPDPQSLGSATSYARRYALQAIVGIAAEDDDGNAATENQAPSQRKAKPAAKPAAKPNSAPISPGEHKITFGPAHINGKLIKELTIDTIQEQVRYWREREKKEGKPLAGTMAGNLVGHMEAYLKESLS